MHYLKKTMNKLRSVIIFLASLNSYGQSFLEVDFNLNGSIYSITQTDFEVTKDSNGNIIKGDTVDCSERIYVFDEHMRIMEEKFCMLDFLSSYKYEYDSDGKLIRRTDFENLDRKYEYDNQGNQTRELMFDSEGLMGSWTYKYDHNGNRIERNGYLGESFVERWIIEYDGGNRKVLEYMVSEEPDNTPTTERIEYEYDTKDKLVKTVSTDPDRKDRAVAVNTYHYNDQGDKTKHYSMNGFHNSREVTKTYQYEYDKKNNWIKRIEFENGIPHVITIRVIEYRN